MAETIPKIDAEIEREDLLLELGEVLHKAEMDDFKRQRKKSPLENYFERIVIISVTLVVSLLLAIIAMPLMVMVFWWLVRLLPWHTEIG